MGLLVTLGFANVLTAVAIILTALSFATDHWIDVKIKRSDIAVLATRYARSDVDLLLANSPNFFSRNRGLFRTCYLGNETLFLDSRDDVIGGYCLPEKGYELTRREMTSDWGKYYDTRIHLMRCHFACMVVSLLMLVVGFLFGAISCYRHRMSWFRVAGIMDFVSAFFIGAAMAFFHGYEYLEKQKIDDTNIPETEEFYMEFKNAVITGTKTLEDFMSWNYGYSYILGWMGMAIAAISAILFLAAAFKLAKRSRHEKYPDYANQHEHGHRNRAYDPMEKYPPAYGTGQGTMAGTYPMAPSAYPDMTNFSAYGY